MRDTSIFQGVKELTDKATGKSFRFIRENPFSCVWEVYRKEQEGEAYVYCGDIAASRRTSNKALFEEACFRFTE